MLDIDVISIGNGVSHHYVEWYVVVMVSQSVFSRVVQCSHCVTVNGIRYVQVGL